MINFNFTVCDEDAENIMFIMNDDILKSRIKIMEFIMKAEKAETEKEKVDAKSWISYYENHIAYTEELISKMKNTRVGDG